MNVAILMGRLTDEPDIRTTQSGHLVARYTLAVDRGKDRSGQQVTDFIRCQAWKERAEFARNYLHKGMKIAVRGSIVTGSYADRDGKTVYTTDINVASGSCCSRSGGTCGGSGLFSIGERISEAGRSDAVRSFGFYGDRPE